MHPEAEISHVLRFVLRRPAAWAAGDAEKFREQLEALIEELAAELNGFQVHDDFGYERELPCEIQKAVAEAVTRKWPPYPGHMHKIEEICQGVIYCVRLRLLERLQDRESRDERTRRTGSCPSSGTARSPVRGDRSQVRKQQKTRPPLEWWGARCKLRRRIP